MPNMEKIERTLRALKMIQKTESPQDPVLLARHKQKLRRASDYTAELEDFINLHPNEFTVVANSTFQRIIDCSDFVGIEEMGYIRIASVFNYPEFECKNYVWLMPIVDL